jgi:DNA helicase-2/ATP-dependent DNA helicase PcrA
MSNPLSIRKATWHSGQIAVGSSWPLKAPTRGDEGTQIIAACDAATRPARLHGQRDRLQRPPAGASHQRPRLPRLEEPGSATIEHMFAWMEQLNEAQRAAVSHEGGPLRVLAGAGTGKTTALSGRVAWLLATGTPAERILLLTFTRRAARQMLDRTGVMLAAQQKDGRSDLRTSRVMGGTFHAVAHRTLRRYSQALGIPEGFSVLDPSDAADVIDLVREEGCYAQSSGRRFPRKALLLDLYSRAVNTGTSISAVTTSVAPWANDFVEQIIEICRGYVASKRAGGMLDFDDLLLLWRAAARDDRLGPRLAGSFDHILVDEYQDVNGLQVDILQALRRTDERITIVGDDAQAVYSFRAAEPRHILDFEQVFPGTRTVILSTNYRSSQQILDVANSVAAEAPEGFSAVLQAANAQAGMRPRLVKCADEDAQASAVCKQILAHREEGIALNEQAVLVRAAHHSNLLELELGRRRIPYVKYGGLRFVEAAHVKDLLAAFRLADNASDSLAWFRLLQLHEGVGPNIARRALAALGLGDPDADPINHEEVLDRWPRASELLPASSRSQAEGLVTALAHRDGGLVAQAERLRVLLVPLIEATYPDSSVRLVDLDSLVAGAAQASRLSDVAADFVLEPPRSTSDLAGKPTIDDEWLTISTIHSAKGLEWTAVHVLNATDGMVPSDMALRSSEGIEEERRVFYVALTRVRKALHVYLPLRYHYRPRGRDDSHGWAQPSRFLSPRVRSKFDEVDVQHELATWASGSAAEAGFGRVGADLESLWS